VLSAAPTGEVYQPAAVLCPIAERTDGLVVHLVRRSRRLSRHAGQVAFPGGRIESGDRDSLDAALREAEEEIGLDPSMAEPVGCLPVYRTGTGFEIRTHVAFVPGSFVARPDGREIESAFTAPLGHLLDPANLRRMQPAEKGRVRSHYAVEWEGQVIWGATAALLKFLSDAVLLSGERQA